MSGVTDDFAKAAEGLKGWDEEELRRLHKGDELYLTFESEVGHFPMTLRDAAKAMTGLDRLLRALSREVDPTHPVEPLLARVDILKPRTRFTVVLVPRRPRPRRRAGVSQEGQ